MRLGDIEANGGGRAGDDVAARFQRVALRELSGRGDAQALGLVEDAVSERDLGVDEVDDRRGVAALSDRVAAIALERLDPAAGDERSEGGCDELVEEIVKLERLDQREGLVP